MVPAPSLSPRGQSQLHPSFSAARAQWENPSDILTVLMIIGGDIVQRAVAQLSGPYPMHFNPVAFSFGWVAYSFSAILSAVGDRRLSPQPDCAATILNAKTGYTRTINSWVLSRLIRDYETQCEKEHGLTITFFRTSPTRPTPALDWDWVYYSGVAVIIVQLGIAAIPGGLYGDWMIFILTFSGTILAILGSNLPQWNQEKWSARPIDKEKSECVCLTRGNGSSYVLVIISEGCGIRLEDLANGRTIRSPVTIPATFALAILWLVHLLTVESLQENAWFSLAVGALGMAHNAVAAGARRTPGALGFQLEVRHVVHDEKVFQSIRKAEEYKEGVGLVLLDVFFPGGLRPHEEEWRRKTKEAREMREQAMEEGIVFRVQSSYSDVDKLIQTV